MLARLASLFRKRLEDDPAAFAAFIARQAAFVAQKTVLDYCRVKAGRREVETFADPDFATALRHCRWRTYAGAAADVAALAEAWLRPHAPGREAALAGALAALCAPVLLPPEAPAEERPSLESAREALPRHLAALQEAPPRSADRLPLLAEAPLLATLPVHPDQRRGETPAIRGALRFHVVSTQQEMERAFDPAGLVRRLLGG